MRCQIMHESDRLNLRTRQSGGRGVGMRSRVTVIEGLFAGEGFGALVFCIEVLLIAWVELI